jgi:hypothetical protein
MVIPGKFFRLLIVPLLLSAMPCQASSHSSEWACINQLVSKYSRVTSEDIVWMQEESISDVNAKGESYTRHRLIVILEALGPDSVQRNVAWRCTYNHDKRWNPVQLQKLG